MLKLFSSRLNKKEKELANVENKLNNLEVYNQELQVKINQLQAEKKKFEENFKVCKSFFCTWNVLKTS